MDLRGVEWVLSYESTDRSRKIQDLSLQGA